MKSIKIIVTGIAMAFLLPSVHLFAQGGGSAISVQGDRAISVQQKLMISAKAIELLKANYIFPERVPAIESFLKVKFNRNGYDSFTTLPGFLQEFNKDLERQGHDHHLNVFFGPLRVKQIKKEAQLNGEKNDAVDKEWLDLLKYENFRLRKLERLEGNIGYFQFLNFTQLAPSKETIVSAMNFMHQSSALILDLRENGGGSAETMNFMLSYFLKDSLQTGEWRYREGNRVEKTYIPSDPVVRKIPDTVPVFILVSKRTASAAEGFSYIMQQFKRAAIVGEQTKGEGNPGKTFVMNDSLYMMIPTIESRNAVSGRGIDGIGVIPDIPVERSKAEDMALLEINQLLAKNTSHPERKRQYEWNIPALRAKLDPQQLPIEQVKNISGTYTENRKIIYENEGLYFETSAGRFKMFYLGNNSFSVDGKEYRINFTDLNQPAAYFQAGWSDGGVEVVKKVKRL